MQGSEVASSTGQGAAAGTAIMPGYGTAIGAGVGFLSGIIGGLASDQARKRAETKRRRLAFLASPQHFQDVIGSLQPLFRELVAQGMGPAFQEEVARSLAQHGYTGTGTGEAMRNASFAIPGKLAFEGASQQAGNVIRNQIAAEESQPLMPPTPNPYMTALLAGARGFLSGSSFNNPNNPANTAPIGTQVSGSGDTIGSNIYNPGGPNLDPSLWTMPPTGNVSTSPSLVPDDNNPLTRPGVNP